MKRIMMMAAMVLLAALAVSCQKEEIGVENLPTFTAHADNGGMKTDLVGNIIHWNNTDQVKVFGNSGYAIYSVTPRPADPTWATLTPSEDHGITGSMPYRFVYPASMAEGGATNNSTLYVTYPAERNIEDAPLKYFPMYGESDQSDVAFRNLGGLVKIVLPEIDREVAYIRVAADEAVAGKYSFASDCSTMSHVGSTLDTSITIQVNGNISEGDEVYVSMPSDEYHNFAITIHTTDGYEARKSGAVVNVAQSAITTIAVSNLSFTRIQAPTLMERAFYDFCERKPIVFHYNYYLPDVEGATQIDDRQNEVPIWRKINVDQVDIYTPAAQINAPANCKDMFSLCSATSIDFGDGFNTANVTNMEDMFYQCLATSIDFGDGFNTANVTNMEEMFGGCCLLTSLNLSSFNTANVTNMGSMFSGCQWLTSLDLSSFNTANVTDMSSMFYGCSDLWSLDLSSFNTANVTDMSSMFDACYTLGLWLSLDLSSFNTVNVTDMTTMFNYCYNLTSLDLSSFNTANVLSMYLMFQGCSKMTSIEFASTATINSLTNINGMLGYLGESATGGCTIHCNDGVKNRLMSSITYYNAAYVHFNTVY